MMDARSMITSVVLGVVGLGAGWSPAWADMLTFYPADDTYIAMNGPSENNCALAELAVRNRYGYLSAYWEADALLKFDLSSLPPNATITAAALHLYYSQYGDNDPAGRALTCYRLLDDWSECMATWDSQPAHAAHVSAATVVPVTVGTWMNWDVGTDVQAFVNGSLLNHGWIIMDEQPWGIFDIPITRLCSKEAGGTLVPYLTVSTGPSAGPLAHWCFEDCAATDCSGHGHDGTNSGAACVAGLVAAHAFDFADTTDIVTYIPSSFDDTIASANALTIAAWVNWRGPNATGRNSLIFDGRSLYPDGGFYFGINRDGYPWLDLLSPSGYHMFPSDGPVDTNTPTHVAATFDHASQTVRIFINGQERGSATYSEPYYDSWFTPALGNNRWAPGDGQWAALNGVLDDLRLYDRALSADELRQLYCVAAVTGDMNCDCQLNFGDINPFVLALSDPAGYGAAYPHCDYLKGDLDGDGFVTYHDINRFVALLSGGSGGLK